MIIPVGGVFKGGEPRRKHLAIIPLRRSRRAPLILKARTAEVGLRDGPVEFWGNPRISLDGAKVSVMQREAVGTRLIGDLLLEEK